MKQELTGKKRFEVKEHFDDGGLFRKDIFVDDKLFPYEVDRDSMMRAKRAGPYAWIQAQKMMGEHFVDSLSEFLGRRVSLAEVKHAKETGWI